MPRYSSDRSDSPVPAKGHRSSRRSISPVRTNSSHKARSPAREKHSSRARSPRRAEVKSPPATSRSRSPSQSPRAKRLRRAQAEREVERASGREYERNGGSRERERDRDRDRARHQKEKGFEREAARERGERRTERDSIPVETSKSRRERSASPTDRRRREKRGSRSPSRAAKNGANEEGKSSRGAEHHRSDDSMAKMKAAEDDLEAKKKQNPSFELSGKLADETNRVRGVTLQFTEPPDARKPDIRWRLYVFKGGEVLNEPLYIHRQSCYLFGRERRVADIPTDHPSCSKQHAVIQFRQVEKEQPDGMLSKQVRPYLMDLGSTNKTFLNDNPIESRRYYELFEKDTIKFGNSSREYVLLHENSSD
ncbi:FHA domain-containing protein DDL isoform X1 [Malania oleifera]|uniref:FHA domain-containing protein DDL isoform X1 n=1 Tax=Malania oleifera TaxID=397392 RepID=UPI0025AE6B59|nr:FHA domain-containing protein DDL isoform X1 [Malania oleifera]